MALLEGASCLNHVVVGLIHVTYPKNKGTIHFQSGKMSCDLPILKADLGIMHFICLQIEFHFLLLVCKKNIRRGKGNMDG